MYKDVVTNGPREILHLYRRHCIENNKHLRAYSGLWPNTKRKKWTHQEKQKWNGVSKQ